LEETGLVERLDMEYNIKIHNQEMRCEDRYCIYLVQDLYCEMKL